MLETGIRHAATVLLESTIRIAPPAAQEWDRAMRGELDQVKGPWEGTAWALGGARIMAREALVSLVMPAGLVADGGLFARSRGARRAATTLALACIVIALLFFASPPFRQAFDVALGPWLGTFRAASADPQHSIRALAQKAEARHDAEGLA